MLESKFQSNLIKEIKDRFPGCVVLKNDSSYLQGIPDLSIFYREHWAMLEVKQSANANHRPNQDYYVNQLNGMSFAKFIYPENKEEVMHELSIFFSSETT